MSLIDKYLGEGLTGPTRMQMQNDLDKLRKIMSIRKATMEVEKMYNVKLTIKNNTIVDIK